MQAVPAVVCVDGTGTNALATVRSLGRRSVPVHVVAVKGARQIASASRYCTGCIEVADPTALCPTLLRLAETLGARAVLYVDNDAMIRLLAPHWAALVQRYEVVEPLAEAERLTDKAFQLRVAQEVGIPVPRTWLPASWAELEEIGRHTRKRLIAKPSLGRLAPGQNAPFKALIAASAEALAAQLRERGTAPADVLVQEYVEGDDAQIHVGLCYRAGDGRSFLLSGRKLRQTQPGAGVMAVGQVIDVPQVRAMTQRLADALDYRGVLCTEFKLDAADGRFYFIEWNPRPAYFQSLGWKAGCDLAYLAYCDRVDPERLPEAPFRHAAGHYWINVRGDLQHLSIVPRLALRPATWAPYLSRKEWAVLALDDPKPWLLAMLQFGTALPKVMVRRLAAGAT